MPRLFALDGKQYTFPDDVSDRDALDFLQNNSAPPSMADVVASTPGSAKRQVMSAMAGVQQVAGDIFDQPEWQQQAQGVKKEVAAEEAQQAPKNMTTLQEGVQSGLSSALAQIPAVAVSGPLGLARVAGGATAAAASRLAMSAGTTYMGAQTGLQRYGDLRAAGFSPARAGAHGVFEGLVEKYTEYLPLKELTGGLKDHLISFLWKDMTGEQIATLLQDMSAKLSDQPDMTLGDYVHDALVTAVATPVAAGAQVGTVVGARALARPVLPAEQTPSPTGQPTPTPPPPVDVGSAEPAGVPTPALPSTTPALPLLGSPEGTSALPSAVGQEKVQNQGGLAGENPVVQAANVGETARSVVQTEARPVTGTSEGGLVEGMMRVYTDPSQKGKMLLVGDTKEALGGSGPLAYADVSESEFNAMKDRVPETARLAADALGLSVVSAKEPLPWKPITPVLTSATPVVPVLPKQAPVEDTTQLRNLAEAKVTFPGSKEQALWKLGTALLRADVKQGVVPGKQLRLLTKAVQAQMPEATPQQAVTAAHEYTMGAFALGSFEQAKTGAFVAPTESDAQAAAQARRDRLVKATVGVAPGTVRSLPGVAQTAWIKKMSGYLKAWVSIYTPQSSVVIAGVADPTKGEFAQTWFDGGVHYVVVPAPTHPTKGNPAEYQAMALLALAHEFGHILISAHINDPALARQRDALLREYAKQVAATQNLTVEQQNELSGSPQLLLEAQLHGGQPFGVPMNAPYADMQSAVAGQQGPDYLGSFDEWAADQFVREATNSRYLLEIPELRGFWQPLMKKMRAFFDGIVKRFVPSKQYSRWLEELQNLSAETVSQMAVNTAPLVHASITQEPVDVFNYTTKVLDRLPKKPFWKKITIYGELGRADVRKQEVELVSRIIKEFPGDSVDAALFRERLLGEIVPLVPNTIPNGPYAEYGMSRLGLIEGGFRAHGPLSSPTARIWQVDDPSYTYESPHYPGIPAYWAHTRFIDGNANMKSAQLLAPGEMPEVGTERSIVEVQSDAEQRGTNSTPLIETLKQRLEMLESQQFIPGRARTQQVETATQISLTRAELEKALQVVERSSTLPKRWAELVLLHENTMAAKDGVGRLRIVGPISLQKVEGFVSKSFYPHLVGRAVEFSRFSPSVVASGAIQGHMLMLTPASVQGRTDTSGMQFPQWVTLTREQLYMLTHDAAGNELPSTSTLEPGQQTIVDKYTKEIIPFVKREFGAKLETDAYGNDWYSWTPTPEIATMPIRYYSLTQAVNNDAAPLMGKVGVPELPAMFTRFQGFLQNTLQLNQVAKILPDVVGLQFYRRQMQSLHALKAAMFAGPNDRLRKWHALGFKQAMKVEAALREEQQGGAHWTVLVQTQVPGAPKPVWIHQPNEGFVKLMQQRGITKKGQDLFLGVKNDFLSTLQMMQDVVERNLKEFFGTNEMALLGRLQAAQDEFEKLRQTPYLPDMRFGKWSVQVRAGKEEVVDGRLIRTGELVYWEKFGKKRERDKRLAELKRDYGKVHRVSGSFDDDTIESVRGLPQSVIDVMTDTLNSSPETKLSQEQMDAIAGIAFDQTAAGKFAKYLGTPKKNIGGASKETQRAYAGYHWKSANAVAKLSYYRPLQNSMNQVKQNAMALRELGQVSDSYDKLLNYLRKNFSYVMQPSGEFEQLRALVSMWYLWGSAKTAAMNLMSVPVLSFPYLSSRFGTLQSTSAMLRAMKDVALYWKNPEKLSPDRQKVLSQFKADGVTDQSFAAMLASVADGGVAFERMIPRWDWMGGEMSYAARQLTWKVSSLGMMPFRVVEQFNRQVTGLAAYDLESQRLGRTLSSGDNTAYQFARDAVDYTQVEYGPWNRPPLMQGKQSILLLFFSFVQNLSFMLFGGDKSWWRAMMVLAALAGLQGLPGMDNFIDIMNYAIRKITGDYVDLRVEAREVAQAIGANPDLVMHGITHSWGIGWDTSSSVGQGRVIPGTDAIFGVGKFEDRFLNAAGEVGGPVGSLTLSFLQALADDNPNSLLAFDRMLPPVLRNLERVTNAVGQGAFTNQKGRPLALDPTNLELAGQALGFSPTRKTQQQEELHTAKDAATFYQLRRQNLMETMYVARQTHDFDTIAEARGKITEFNQSVPSPALRINAEDIAKSMAARAKMDKETELGRAPSKRYQDLYSQTANVF